MNFTALMFIICLNSVFQVVIMEVQGLRSLSPNRIVYCTMEVEGGHKCECLQVFKALVRARVKLELKYYLKMEDLDIFHEMWDWEDILFTIKKTGLLFEDMLIEV